MHWCFPREFQLNAWRRLLSQVAIVPLVYLPQGLDRIAACVSPMKSEPSAQPNWSRSRSAPCSGRFWRARLAKERTTPRIEELYLTPDHCLLARVDGEVTHKHFLGAEEDLIRNIHGVDGDEVGYLLGLGRRRGELHEMDGLPGPRFSSEAERKAVDRSSSQSAPECTSRFSFAFSSIVTSASHRRLLWQFLSRPILATIAAPAIRRLMSRCEQSGRTIGRISSASR